MTPKELSEIINNALNYCIKISNVPEDKGAPTIYNAKCNITYPHDLFHTKSAMVLKDRTGKEFVIYVRLK